MNDRQLHLPPQSTSRGNELRSSTALLGLALLGLMLASCAPGLNEQLNTPNAHGVVAGFWLGLWHGLITPVTFIVSLFNRAVQVYEVHNTGGRYNFGFLLGASIVFGGGGRGSASRSKRRAPAASERTPS